MTGTKHTYRVLPRLVTLWTDLAEDVAKYDIRAGPAVWRCGKRSVGDAGMHHRAHLIASDSFGGPCAHAQQRHLGL